MNDNELLDYAERIDARSQIEDIFADYLPQILMLVGDIAINKNHDLSDSEWEMVSVLLAYAVDKFLDSNDNKEQESDGEN